MNQHQTPQGPYEVILTPAELGARLKVSPEKVLKWEKLGMPVMRDRPMRTQGRCYKRYDLWKVFRFLERHN